MPDDSTWKIHKHLKYNTSVNELNLFSFFTRKYVSSYILFLSDNGITIHPATAAKILSLSHSWSPMLNQWLYPAMHLAKISQFYPLFACFPPLLWKLSEFYLHHFRYLVICFLVITITCSSLHASYVTHWLDWATAVPHALRAVSHLCALVFCFVFSFSSSLYIHFLPSLPDYSCFKTQLKCHLLLEEFPDFLIISSPTPTANLDPGLSLPLSMSSERPKCIFAKLYCNDLCLTDTAILNSMNLEGKKHFVLVYVITT